MPQELETLKEREPRVGDLLTYSGTEWAVTDYSLYKNDEGYAVEEWCCEDDDTEAYLLKEAQDSGPPRWFFTRWIDGSMVTSSTGETLPDWNAALPPPEPPKTLHDGAQLYDYKDTTDGVYEDEPGEKVRKLTWDYWSPDHKSNLAVELWGDGGRDCYRGRYVEVHEVAFAPRGRGAERPVSLTGLQAGIIIGAVVLFFTAFFGGMPIDAALVLALPAAAVMSLAVMDIAPPAAAAAAAGAAILAWVFGRWPPLSTVPGLAALLGVPAALAALARGRKGTLPERESYLAGVAAFLPAFGWGAWHYFRHAPSHAVDTLALALAPSALAAAAAYGTARYVCSRVGQGDL